jgi:hypothetical protein
MIIPTPSDDQRGAVERKEEITLKIKSTSADQGTPSTGTQTLKSMALSPQYA